MICWQPFATIKHTIWCMIFSIFQLFWIFEYDICLIWKKFRHKICHGYCLIVFHNKGIQWLTNYNSRWLSNFVDFWFHILKCSSIYRIWGSHWTEKNALNRSNTDISINKANGTEQLSYLQSHFFKVKLDYWNKNDY